MSVSGAWQSSAGLLWVVVDGSLSWLPGCWSSVAGSLVVYWSGNLIVVFCCLELVGAQGPPKGGHLQELMLFVKFFSKPQSAAFATLCDDKIGSSPVRSH